MRWAQAMIGKVQLLSLLRPKDLARVDEVLDQIIAYVENPHG